MTIMVTGSAGLVGHAVVTLLRAAGRPVVGVDRDATSVDGIEQVPCDLTDHDGLDRIARAHGVDTIVHCGGASGPMVLADDPRRVVAVNVGGTTNVLDVARRHGMRRVVYCSSIAAYGTTPAAPVPESAPLCPLDVYGATKAAGEHLVAAFRAQHGVPGVSLRISTVFGPRRRTDCLIRALLVDAMAGRLTSLAVASNAPQQFVHVDDVAAAAVAAVDAPDPGAAYNVTGGTVTTVQEVIDTVRRVDPRLRAAAAPPDPVDAARWPARLDLAAAARDLGWRPRRDFAGAVAEYRDALRRGTG